MDTLWTQYRICSQSPSESTLQLTGLQFIERSGLSSSLHHIQYLFQAPDQKVAASLFVKRYCSYTAVLQALSCMDKKVSLPLGELSFSCTPLKIFTHAPHVAVHTADEDRYVWRKEVLQQLFQEHVSVIIEALENETGFPASVMWAHVSFYIHFAYRQWMREEQYAFVRERIQEDFHYLQSAPAEWFGACGYNPLQQSFCTMRHPVEGEAVMLRKACCLNYRAGSSKGACYTCPRLTEEERLEKLQAVYKKA